MKRARLVGAVCACIMPFVLANITHATPVAYTNQAAFLAALPGAPSTLDFDGIAAGTTIADGGTAGGFTFTYGTELANSNPPVSITVTDGNQSGGGGPFDTTSGSNFLGTDDRDIFQSGDDFSLGFGPVNAIGMFFISIETPDSTCSGAIVICPDDIVLSAAGEDAFLDISEPVALPDGGNTYFLGIIDDMNTFSVSDITSICCGFFTFNIDDIITASSATTQAPEPGTLAIFALGLAGFGLARRRPSHGVAS